MLPSGFRERLHEELLRFLWRQWSQLGVAGKISFEDNWIIDPEALLLATLHLGRFDPRLFDETLDWCIRNAAWISIQRLKNLVQKQNTSGSDNGLAIAPAETLTNTLAAFSAVMDAHDTTVRWKTLMRAKARAERDTLPFFLDRSGKPLPVFGESDPYFFAAGWERSPFKRRGLSVAPPMDALPCLLLKLRSLFGLSPRAEVIAYLLTHSAAGAREAARATSYSATTTHYALTELSAGHFLSTMPGSAYAIDAHQWRELLRLPALPPPWVDWRRIFAALTLIVDTFDSLVSTSLSEYLYASRMLRLSEALAALLFDCGVLHPFAMPCRLENVAEILPDRIQQFVTSLNQGGKSASLPEQ
jgi:hypothetical protein